MGKKCPNCGSRLRININRIWQAIHIAESIFIGVGYLLVVFGSSLAKDIGEVLFGLGLMLLVTFLFSLIVKHPRVCHNCGWAEKVK